MKITQVHCFVLLLTVLLGCAKSTTPPTPPPPPPPVVKDINLTKGLLAYYPLNGNANDFGPNHLNGVLNAGVSFTQDVAGKSDSAALFDGASGYIKVVDSSGKLAADSVSISFLIYLSDVTNRSAIINKVNYDDATGLGYAVNVSSPTSNLQFNFGAIPGGFRCDTTNYDFNDIIANGTVLLIGKWYHVIATFADSTEKLYVNGTLATSKKQNYSTLNKCANNPYLLIGGWWKNDIISLHGKLDEVRIYNRSLTPDEITELAKPVN